MFRWFHVRVGLYFGSDSVQCLRSGQLGYLTCLVDLVSLCPVRVGYVASPLACGYEFDRVLNDFDAVVGHDPAPHIAKPIAMTLTTLRQDAKRAAEELAFKSRRGIANGHGGDAHGDERLRSQEQPAGSHFQLTTALALANAGEGGELSTEQAKLDNKEGSSSDRDEDAPVNAPQGGRDKSPSEGRGQAEGDAAERDDVMMDNRGGDCCTNERE
ncbi:unnamed protein product [Closterium sp. NIES-54]